MSLRWIQENQEAPICDEESSDIDDSSGSDSEKDQVDLRVIGLGENEEDDEEEEEDADGENKGGRKRRETFRHPTTTVSLKNIRKNALRQGYDPNVQMGNPTYGPVMQLHSMTGYRLAILPSGKVRGFDSDSNKYALLKVTSVAIAVVQIQGMETGLYLAFDERGRLYGEKNKENDNTTWQHLSIGSYDSYLSKKYTDREWYVGIKSNGRPKNGQKTAIDQKATKFLPIR